MRQQIKLNERVINKTLDEGYDEFILYCKSRNLRPATIKHYNNAMLVIYKYIPPKTQIKDITQDTVEGFKMFMKNNTNQNDVTMNTNLRSLRAILYYFMKLEYMESFHIAEMKVDKQIIETYTDAELKLLLKKPDLKKCSFTEYREFVIVNFLLGTGCRLGTLVNIKIKDLDFENDLIIYTHTKNRYSQAVPMSNNLKKILMEYLQFRKGEPDDYLFCTAYGEKINEDTLKHSIKIYNNKHGVIKSGIHRFRHTFAKKWILGGGDVFRLQKILGHSSMDVVKNYVNMFTDDLQNDFNKFNPLEQLKINREHIDMKKGGKQNE